MPNAVAAAVGFSAIGLLGLAWSLLQVIKGIRTRGWPVTHGTITQSGLEAVQPSFWRGSYVSYRPVLSYSFDVGGKTWTGQRVIVSDSSTLSYPLPKAQARLSEYPAGLSVQVYFNPSDPSECVLVPGIPSGVLWGIGGATGAIAFGLWLFFELTLQS